MNKDKGSMPMHGYFYVLTAAVLMGSGGTAGTVLFGFGLDPFDVVTMRFAIASVILLFYMLLFQKEHLKIAVKDLLILLPASFGKAILFVLFFFSVMKTNVATANILLYTAPAFIVIISYFTLKESLTRLKIISLLLTFAGGFLIAGGYNPKTLQFDLLGYGAGLGAGLTYALYVVLIKSLLAKYSPWTLLFYSLTFGSGFLFFIKPPWLFAARGFPPAVWILTAYLSVVITLLASYLYIYGLKQVEASKAGILATAEPLSAALVAFLVLGQTLVNWQIAGFGLVLISIILLSSMSGRR